MQPGGLSDGPEKRQWGRSWLSTIHTTSLTESDQRNGRRCEGEETAQLAQRVYMALGWLMGWWHAGYSREGVVHTS